MSDLVIKKILSSLTEQKGQVTIISRPELASPSVSFAFREKLINFL